MLTFKTVKTALRLFNVTITRTMGGQYRVNLAKGKEATAYYTNDLRDAFGTGIDMADRARTKV
jgi:hypothetical protein